MALFVGTFDLPPQEKLSAFMQAVPRWYATIRQQPGLKEFRSYRNPCRGSPEVMNHYEFDSLESLYRYMQSEDYAGIMAELRAMGAHDFSSGQVWVSSPTAPQPIKPAAV